jgi:hypothetical protein
MRQELGKAGLCAEEMEFDGLDYPYIESIPMIPLETRPDPSISLTYLFQLLGLAFTDAARKWEMQPATRW